MTATVHTKHGPRAFDAARRRAELGLPAPSDVMRLRIPGVTDLGPLPKNSRIMCDRCERRAQNGVEIGGEMLRLCNLHTQRPAACPDGCC